MGDAVYTFSDNARWDEWGGEDRPFVGCVWEEFIDDYETRRCELWEGRWFFTRERALLASGRLTPEDLADLARDGHLRFVGREEFEHAWRQAWDLGLEFVEYPGDKDAALEVDPAASVHQKWPVKAIATFVRPRIMSRPRHSLMAAGWAVAAIRDITQVVSRLSAEPCDVVIFDLKDDECSVDGRVVDDSARTVQLLEIAGQLGDLPVPGAGKVFLDGSRADRKLASQLVPGAVLAREQDLPEVVERFRTLGEPPRSSVV